MRGLGRPLLLENELLLARGLECNRSICWLSLSLSLSLAATASKEFFLGLLLKGFVDLIESQHKEHHHRQPYVGLDPFDVMWCCLSSASLKVFES